MAISNTQIPPFTQEAASRLDALIAEHAKGEGAMLPALHAIQDAFGYIPDEAVLRLSETLNLSRAEVHGVVTFYHDFRPAPAGRHVIKACRAEACQSVGGEAAANQLLSHLKLGWGETTRDGRITVEPVYCLGLCAVAPSALVDGAPKGRVDGASLIADADACTT